MSILGFAFFVAALLVAAYGANTLLLALLYLRQRPRQRQARTAYTVCKVASPDDGCPSTQADWPILTVQLPVYNELHVVQRVIDAVAHLDYPRDRLQVQVLDDSTDETTRLAQTRVAHHQARGLDIELIRRRDRRGFKAGALQHGLETARGELIAIFDADFVPPAHFLRQVVPALLADPGLAFAQARWGHLNPDASALTRAQAIALDGHFVVEHLARNQSGLLINFNGTAGIWRREAIAEAGGWQCDTLTEDVDLSFRAQLAGWRALYLPDVVTPAELPPQMAAFRRQQARWASGAAQCLFKLGGRILRGRLHPAPAASQRLPAGTLPLSWPARLEALLHLSVWLAHPMSLLLLLLTLPMLLGKIPLTLNLSIFWFVAFGPVFAYALAQRHLYRDWTSRMLYMPVLALLGTGLALSNTLAIAQGLTGRKMPFQRTPKFHVVRPGDRWQGSRYALAFQWVTLGELALALYALATAVAAVWTGAYFSVPFLLLYVGGYGTIGLHGVWDAWLARKGRAYRAQTRAVAQSRSEAEWADL